MKLLFIAYHFEPFPGVGSKRISYWAKHAKELDCQIQLVDVITTTENAQDFEGIDNIFTVPTEYRKNRFPDIGRNWLKPLRNFLKDHLKGRKYDYAIITGNPFGHFFIQNSLKRKGIRPVLDFRDPMAINPRAQKTLGYRLKLPLRVLLETYFISKSSMSICINNYCQNLVYANSFLRKKIRLIDNGFDEIDFQGLVQNNSNSEKLTLAFAGSAYKDRDPSNLIDAIKGFDEFELILLGKNPHIENSDRIKNLGLKSYRETMGILNQADILVLLTSGFPFESSTKVFDYIALRKPILVIEQEVSESTAIKDILRDYPSKLILTNDAITIKNRLKDVVKLKRNFEYDCQKFSRANGFKKLMTYLKEE